MRLAAAVAIACAAAAVAGCDDGGPGLHRAAEVGRALFSDPRLSDSGLNAYACSTCHVTTAAPAPERIDSGHPLGGVAARAAWWGGRRDRLFDAVNDCLVYFMRASRPLDEDDPAGRALFEYLHSLGAAPPQPALPLTVVENLADVPRGDPARGAVVYRQACRICHGDEHTGAGRPSPVAPVLPESLAEYATLFPGTPTALPVIEKIRHGGFFRVGGVMPFYATELLSDAELGALLAHFGI